MPQEVVDVRRRANGTLDRLHVVDHTDIVVHTGRPADHHSVVASLLRQMSLVTQVGPEHAD